MKNKRVIVSVIALGLLMITASVFPVMGSEKKTTILFTHDTHSNLLPFKGSEGEAVVEKGGFARIKTLIDQERENNPIIVDAGDFSMGTLFQTIYETDATELRMLGALGYEVTTFGNHEFDFRTQGLTNMLTTAKDSGDALPQIVASNIIFPKNEKGELTNELSDLQKAFTEIKVKEYTIIEKNGVRIGVFGLFGADSAACAPMAEVEFEDISTAAERTVEKLKGEDVDLIIALSHSGVDPDPEKSEDEILAKNVPEIDVIVSGHTHTVLDEPKIVGNTMIVSAGAYGENLGKLVVIPDHDRWKVDSYELISVSEAVPFDEGINSKISDYKNLVQEEFLKQYDYSYDEVLGKTNFSFQSIEDLFENHTESGLGNLITDSYIYSVKEAEGDQYEEVAAAILPNGVIRGSFYKGDIRVTDAFNVSSLGIGKDGISGYPLVSVYLTGKELKTVGEVDASITDIMPSAQLYTSGLEFTYNPNRLIFNKVTEAHLVTAQGIETIEDESLYRVIVGLYSGQMLGAVEANTYGILSLVPKDKEGNPITNFEDHIIYNNGKELKEWVSLAKYIASFEQENNVSIVPEYYNTTHNRKNSDDDVSIKAWLENPNEFATMIYGVTLFLVLTIVFIINRILTRKRRRLRKMDKQKINLQDNQENKEEEKLK